MHVQFFYLKIINNEILIKENVQYRSMIELCWVFFICTPRLEARCVVIKYEWNNCCQLSFHGTISALVLEIAHMKQLTLDDVTFLKFQLFVFLKVCKGEMRGLSLYFFYLQGVILIVLCHCQHATFQLQNIPLPNFVLKKTLPFRFPFLCLIFLKNKSNHFKSF